MSNRRASKIFRCVIIILAMLCFAGVSVQAVDTTSGQQDAKASGKLTYNSNYQYTIQNGNQSTIDQIISFGYDIVIQQNQFNVPNGYTFAGWNTKPDGTGTQYSPGEKAKFSSNTTLYAIWSIQNEFPNTPKTTIDMTFIQEGGGVNCNHVWEVKHGYLDSNGKPVEQSGNTTYHWEQCWKCGSIINLEKHTMHNTTDAPNTCNPGTPQLVAKCTGLGGRCNYTEQVPKLNHVTKTLDTPIRQWAWGYHIQHVCQNCGIELEPETNWCRDARGNKLGCGNAGTCAICGQYYDGRHLQLTTGDDYWDIPGIDGNFTGDTQPTKTLPLMCYTCKKQFGKITFSMHRDGDAEGRNYTIDYGIYLDPSVQIALNFSKGSFDSINGDLQNWNYSSGNVMHSGNRDYSVIVNGTPIDVTNGQRYILAGNNKMQIRVHQYPTSILQYLYQFLWLGTDGDWTINGQPQERGVCIRHIVPNELGRPIYVGQQNQDDRVPNVPANQLNGTAGWSTKQQVTIKFADLIKSNNNALNNVWIQLKDRAGGIIHDWTVGNRGLYNANYPGNLFTGVFDIVAEAKGSETITAMAHDATWNTQEAKVEVQNIDSLAPQPANEFVTSQEWQRTKDFSYLFTDKGIGHIQISFNNNSYEVGNEQDIYEFANTDDWVNYSRDYTLTGDVTGAAGVTIYAKDLLGNTESYKATVYNLDNTKPKVEKCEVQYESTGNGIATRLQVQDANDFCDKIQKDGSGIAGYAIVKVPGDKGITPQAPAEPQEAQFVKSNTFEIDSSGWYFVYAIDNVQWVSDPYPIYVDKIEQNQQSLLVTAVDAQAANGHGGINLLWQFNDWGATTNKAWQTQAGNGNYQQVVNDPSKWTPVQLIDLQEQVEPIYVLNLIPALGTDDIGQALPQDPQQGYNREWTFPEYDWNGYATGKTYTVNMVQFGALKAWMEGGSVKNLEVGMHDIVNGEDIINTHYENQQYDPYGQSPYTKQQVIRVVPLYTREVNKDISKYLWYDSSEMAWKTKVDMHGMFDPNGREVEVSEILVGTADVNGWENDQPQQELTDLMKKFLDTGGQIVAGHDTIGGYYGEGAWRMKQLRDRFKIWTATEDTTQVPRYGLWGSTVVTVTKQGLLTNFPYELPLGTKLTIPLAHTVGNSSYGTVWMDFQDDGKFYDYFLNVHEYPSDIQGDSLYYLTTNGNTAMIQTGHQNCISTQDERKIIANTLFYLKQTSSFNKAIDNSAQDFAAPDKVSDIETSSITKGQITATVGRPKDNGTDYTHVAQQFLKTNIADEFGLNNGNINTTNFVQQEVTTGVKGYYYFIDDNKNSTLGLTDGIIQTSSGIKLLEQNKNVPDIEKQNTIYNKEIQIEYDRSTINQQNGTIESVEVNQSSETDKEIQFNINQSQLRKDYNTAIEVYLHIVAYDNAGNVSETTTVPIKLTQIIYKANGGVGEDVIQAIMPGVPETTYGNIFQKENARFSGWNTQPDGTGKHYDASTSYTFDDSIILYAEWDAVQKLTINPNGGQWKDSGSVVIKPGTDGSLTDKEPTNKVYKYPISFHLGDGDEKGIEDPLKQGYNFYGWLITQTK